MACHVAPEAPRGGPIAAVRDGDVITFDVASRTLELGVDQQVIEERIAAYDAPLSDGFSGVLSKYARGVGSASQGAVCV
jgi:dihydroxy-acid dehydratase